MWAVEINSWVHLPLIVRQLQQLKIPDKLLRPAHFWTRLQKIGPLDLAEIFTTCSIHVILRYPRRRSGSKSENIRIHQDRRAESFNLIPIFVLVSANRFIWFFSDCFGTKNQCTLKYLWWSRRHDLWSWSYEVTRSLKNKESNLHVKISYTYFDELYHRVCDLVSNIWEKWEMVLGNNWFLC